MKFGFRKPSLKGRISARTSPKRFLRHNLGLKAPKGGGWFTNPKKAAYNRVYNKTSKGCMTFVLQAAFVVLLGATVLAIAAVAQTATVIAENANLRGTPSQSGKVVDTIAQNTIVEIIKQRSSWFLVQTSDYAGWLHGNTIRLSSALTVSSVDDSNARDMMPVRPSYTPPPQTRTIPSSPRTTSGRTYIRGPRGGCYYWNSNGRKTYVDRTLCN